MQYDIIATLGPASAEPGIWRQLAETGASAFRLNTSHLALPELDGWLGRLDPFLSARAGFPLVLDLQGSKWRLGICPSTQLEQGQEVVFFPGEQASQPGSLPVPHADFFAAARASSGEITLNDARVRLQIVSITPEQVRAVVTLGGPVSARKGITFTNSAHRVEVLSEKDRRIVERAAGLPGVQFAVSYVKDAAEMTRYRSLVGPDAHLIAKLERRAAMDEAAQIADAADALWVCRGDLGAELGLPEMARSVRRVSAQVPSIRRPVIMAGQVLEHMTASATPTRSEVCHLLDLLEQGYRGVVLSDETAVGSRPVEACRAAAVFRT